MEIEIKLSTKQKDSNNHWDKNFNEIKMLQLFMIHKSQ